MTMGDITDTELNAICVYRPEVILSRTITPDADTEPLLVRTRHFLSKWTRQNWNTIRILTVTFFIVAFVVFLGFGIRHSFTGSLVLVVVTALAISGIVYLLIRDNYGDWISRKLLHPLSRVWDKHWDTTKW